jgi:hypothetical protein
MAALAVPPTRLPPAPSAGAVEIATLLSVAVRIEPELIRAIRLILLPRLDVGAEGDLWFSHWVVTREADAIVLRDEVVLELRQRLAERLTAARPDDPARRLWDVVASVHGRLSPALLVEERLAWLAVNAAGADEIDVTLRPALRAALAGRRTGIARWFVRAWQRLPEAARHSTAAWQLAQLARGRSGQAATLHPVAPAHLELGHVAVVADALDDARLLVVHDGDRLVVSSAPLDGGIEITVPDTDPRVLTATWGWPTRDQTVLVPAAGDAELNVGGSLVWLRTARGALYEVAPASAKRPDASRPRVYLSNVDGREPAHELWRFLRLRGCDAAIGLPPDNIDTVTTWFEDRVASADYILVLAQHGPTAEDAVHGLLRRSPRQWRERVIGVLLPEDDPADLPAFVRGYGLRVQLVTAVTDDGARELLDVLFRPPTRVAPPGGVTFYDVKTRKSVQVPESDVTKTKYERTTSAGKIQVRYALRGNYEGRNLTKFVGQADWEALDAPVE